jgi:hypothetical protein
VPVRRILRLAPWPVRRRLLGALDRRLLPYVPAHLRLRLARWMVPIVARPRRAAPDGSLVRVRRVTARTCGTAGPAEVRAANLDRVVAALDAAGVDWFRIPAGSVTHTAVAVPDRYRERAVTVLKDLTGTGHGLVETVLGRPRNADVLRVCWPVTDAGRNLVLGPEFGCEVEFWRQRAGELLGPRGNPVADIVAADAPPTWAPENAFGPFCAADGTAKYRTRSVFTMASPERVTFPIDVVYTWVDGSDPDWRERKARALGDNTWVAGVSDHSANSSRFASRDELRYSLRALHCFAPWVRRVFLVTDDQVPAWLDTEHPGVTVVSHREVFGSTGRLPTFNSHAIESRLHRIPGLSEHFLYLNDDVFLGCPVTPELFFTPGGLTRFFPSRAVVDSAPRRPDDLPVNSAGKNNRRLIQQAFGRVLTRKMMHTPHPSRRSVINEIEQRFADDVAATAAHQFRHPDDVSLLTSLQQYYAYLTGRAAPGQIRYMYADLADASAPFKMARVLRNRNLDAFCLNDTDSDAATAAVQASLLAEFLPAYLPFASPYELSTPRAAAGAPRLPVVGRQVIRTRTPENSAPAA